VLHTTTPQPTTIALGIDNKGSIDMGRSEGPTKRTKRIDVKHRYLQQQVATNVFRLQQISTTDQKADFLFRPSGRSPSWTCHPRVLSSKWKVDQAPDVLPRSSTLVEESALVLL
jgi:hypothetical protein